MTQKNKSELELSAAIEEPEIREYADFNIEINGHKVRINAIEECSIPGEQDDMERHHERITAKIALVNSVLEGYRNRKAELAQAIKEARSEKFIYYKEEYLTQNGKPPSNDFADSLVVSDKKVTELEHEKLEVESNERKLQDLVYDLRSTRVSIETIMKTRVNY